MSIRVKLGYLMEQEENLMNEIKNAVNLLVDEIKNTPLEGVQVVSPNICIVKLSALTKWSPEYYLPTVQAGYIEQALQDTTPREFYKKLLAIVDKKGVKISSNFYPLNPTTIKIINKYF